jgi:hypothetical protein
MAGAASTKSIRDGASSSFTAREWDEQNPSPGDGPFSAMPVLSDGEGNRLSRAEDSAHTSGDHGVMALGVRKDAAAALAGSDGDYQPPIYDANGKLWVNLASLETKLDTLHTDLATTLAGYVDGLEALITATNGYVDGLEALAAAATPAGSNLIGKVGIDQTTDGTTNRVTVGGVTLVDVTLTLDTSAYASGDLLADTQVVSNAMRLNDVCGILHSLTVVDEDDQGVAFDVYLLSANNTLGTENAAPTVSDANARDILTKIPIATTDYYDLGGVRIAEVHGLSRVVKPASGSKDLYVAVVNGTGTPTFTASGVRLRLGFIQQ